MSARVMLFLGVMVTAVAVMVVLRNGTQSKGTRSPRTPAHDASSAPLSQPSEPQPTSPSPAISLPRGQSTPEPRTAEEPTRATNKLYRLAEVREMFRGLAKGDPSAAMQAARQLTDPTERETALLTLVTDWTRGELSPPAIRARAVVAFGLEAGLGMELAHNPKLAALWAEELTEGQGRLALLSSTAAYLVDTDPSGAFGLGQLLHDQEQRTFTETLFESWAQKDTQAALQWVTQLPDPTERDLALESIRQVAPVGIGAAVGVREGYPVIMDLVPDGPAARNGQLGMGDRIVALAQEGSTPIDTKGLSLEAVVNMIRGAPGTRLQLQVEAAGSAPGAPPRTVWISRDQVTFKR